ncbi:MAG: hypothetical protein A3F82_05390 [Deltaproteobacteria bacterium RIFCSPLOWO2_12_FULL_44_12]|nr:MAG: hypothetical protein A3I70_07025 [Deltaproteobacteria bacterium RIFCSPLOWO2_02_FULL_44_34]OGQ69871.1 MAG: hypothetical protein A3F82_05390 [Deltaproteobacteria bacterium RIFCSPLOWO2_12_FULL_44_12]
MAPIANILGIGTAQASLAQMEASLVISQDETGVENPPANADQFVIADEPLISPKIHSNSSPESLAAFGMFGLSPLSLAICAGGLLMAKLMRRPLSQLLITTLGTTWAATTMVEGNWPLAIELYLSGCATLRMIKHFNIHPSTQKPIDARSFRDYFDVSKLPRLRDKYGRDECYTKAVDALEKILMDNPKLQQFFDFDPRHQSLLDEMGWVRIADDYIGKISTATGSAKGIFVPMDETLYTGGVVEFGVHELAHVLHFTAIRKKVSFNDLQRVKEYFDTHDVHQRIAPFLDTVRQHLVKSDSGSPIPHEVRNAAAILIFQIGKGEFGGHHESVPTFLQTKLSFFARSLKFRPWMFINQLIAWFLMPMAWIGGIHRDTQFLNPLFAYDNPFILRRVLKLGPIDSLLGSEG